MVGRPRYRAENRRPDYDFTGGFRRITYTAFFFLLLGGCVREIPESKASGYSSRHSYPNLLDFSFLPGNKDDFGQKVFYDGGAWHGYALPPKDSSAYWGRFTGPFLHDKNEWLSKSILEVQVFEAKGSDPASAPEKIDFNKAEKSHIYSIPGRLRQVFQVDSLQLELDLIFSSSSNRTAAVFLKISNSAPRARFFEIRATGSIFKSNLSIAKKDSTGIIINSPDGKPVFALSWAYVSSGTLSIHTEEHSYSIINRERLTIDNRQSRELIFELAHYPDTLRSDPLSIKRYPEILRSENHVRWDNYLKRLDLSADSTDVRLNRVAVKAFQTLMMNYREGYGDLYWTKGTLPSASISYFNGFWAWDSWKHVVAIVAVDSAMAKEQMIHMMKFQNERGMIADCVFPDSSENNWRDSKPPLAAWAAENVFGNDLPALKAIFPSLLKYHRWWYADRDHDKNGLCEYGSTDGTIVAARWESGMDDAIRFDYARMLKNGHGAWSMNQESVDLNAYLYYEKNVLAKMAGALGYETLRDSLKTEAGQLKILINNRFFDSETGFFYDAVVGSDSLVKVKGPEGWIPLWAGAATGENAARTLRVMTDSTFFATEIPFPTVAKNEKGFMTGYWRGPVWLDQAYFAVAGLAKYGFEEEAKKFANQLLTRPEGIDKPGFSIRENYDPITGEGLKVHNFSWSAAHLLLLQHGLKTGEWK